MPTGITKYGDISQRTAFYAAKEMLDHAAPVLVLQRFAMTKPIPANTSEAVKFRRPIPFTVSTTPLVEGVTPTAHKMSYEDVAFTLQQYGDVVEITDKLSDQAEDPVRQDATMLSGEQAGATVEALMYGQLKAGTSVYYANGSARTDVNTALTLDLQREVTAFLARMKAKKITQVLNGSAVYGSSAVEAAYVAFVHTDLESDIRNLNGFIPTAKYGQRSVICPEEIGTVENVRYIGSPDLTQLADAGGAKNGMRSTSGTYADVYPIIIVGQNSYGTVALKGRNGITPTVLNPNTPRGGDPLGQRGTVGWKTYWAGGILNDTWLCRVEVAATARS